MRMTSPSHEELISGTSFRASADACAASQQTPQRLNECSHTRVCQPEDASVQRMRGAARGSPAGGRVNTACVW